MCLSPCRSWGELGGNGRAKLRFMGAEGGTDNAVDTFSRWWFKALLTTPLQYDCLEMFRLLVMRETFLEEPCLDAFRILDRGWSEA